MKEYPKLLIADKNGKIFDVPWLEATGMKGGEYFRLDAAELIPLHQDSEFFLMPCRSPVGYDTENKKYIKLRSNPLLDGDEQCSAVAAFVSPGYVTTYNAAYSHRKGASLLPLFSYAAVAFYKNKFYAACMRIDRERRQELAGMDISAIRQNAKMFSKLFPKNRLLRHLQRCALSYGCPAAKNFFLNRYECPLPTSSGCNAKCIGCISYQEGDRCSVTQPRITFIPTAEEVAEIALFHIKEVRDPVVSFGQGCEGEPLMVSKVLEEAVSLIRKTTQKGIINLNTNASRPDVIKRLFDSGLDSIRVSMNSVQPEHYTAYYRPKGYKFHDVCASIKNARTAGGFVSINYLGMPGFTDSVSEVNALRHFLDKMDLSMIQWRNLNYDPKEYFKKMKVFANRNDMIGMDVLIDTIKKEYPKLMHGYFNPSRGRIRRVRSQL